MAVDGDKGVDGRMKGVFLMMTSILESTWEIFHYMCRHEDTPRRSFFNCTFQSLLLTRVHIYSDIYTHKYE